MVVNNLKKVCMLLLLWLEADLAELLPAVGHLYLLWARKVS
jgi:hypothetical protein